MPAVSVILPTYNRADTILRAVNSVIAQSFAEWELLIIDDGSTDNTIEMVSNLDPRIRVIRQQNLGVYVARNKGLSLSQGDYITFLDSDDEWTPSFLAVTVAFMRAHPDEHYVSTEFFQDWGTSERVRHDFQIITQSHVKKARAFGSDALNLPAGETDDYLRVYSEKLPIGAWGEEFIDRADLAQGHWYRGHIFHHMRWGYLNWLPVILITRDAANKIGPFREEFRNGADFYFLAMLSRGFRANMIGIPCAFKHEKSGSSSSLKEGHLAGGKNSYRLASTHLQFFEELFLQGDEPEIGFLHKAHHLECGRAALGLGLRGAAIRHLWRAAAPRQILWRSYPLFAIAALPVSGRLTAYAYSAVLKLEELVKRLKT